MALIRPIPRDVSYDDVNAATKMFIHEVMGHQPAPQANPGILLTHPESAGTQVKPQLGGGYFAPPAKTSKFK